MPKAVNQIDKDIGQRIRHLRVVKSMSQSKLADVLGLSFQQVQKYEKGANRIGGSRMQQIATALGVEPSYFFGEKGKRVDSDSDIMKLVDRADTVRMLRAFSLLKGAKRAAIINLAESMAGK